MSATSYSTAQPFNPFYASEFTQMTPISAPSPTIRVVEVNGTTYFIENLTAVRSIPGAFEYNGTTYFPRPNVDYVPGSYIKGGTTFFPQNCARSPESSARTSPVSQAPEGYIAATDPYHCYF